jgi:hypothetical protein
MFVFGRPARAYDALDGLGEGKAWKKGKDDVVPVSPKADRADVQIQEMSPASREEEVAAPRSIGSAEPSGDPTLPRVARGDNRRAIV